jgi:hypothetical protein
VGFNFIDSLEQRIYREADSFLATDEILLLLSNTPLKDILRKMNPVHTLFIKTQF